MPALITTDLVALDADLGADKGAVVQPAGRTGRRRRPRHRRRRAARRRHGPRGAGRHRAARRHRDPALPVRARDQASLGVRAAVPEGRLRRTGRPGRPRLPDRRTRARRRRPPHAADRAGPGARPAGVRRLAAGGDLREEIVRLVAEVVSPAPDAGAPPQPPAGAATPAAPAAATAATPAAHRRRHARARPGSRTPTWPPTSSRPPAKAAGVDLHVETQGSSGSTPLDPALIRGAPTRSSSPSTSASATATGSPASRSSRPASSGRSTSPT